MMPIQDYDDHKTRALLDEFVDETQPRGDIGSEMFTEFFRWVVINNKDATGLQLPTHKNDCVLLGGDGFSAQCPYCIIIRYRQQHPDTGLTPNLIVYKVLNELLLEDEEVDVDFFKEAEEWRAELQQQKKHNLIADMVKKYTSKVKSGEIRDVGYGDRPPWLKLSVDARYRAMEEEYDRH
jgi:hypothetical protein